MIRRDVLFVPEKKHYVRGDRPKVDCILCSVEREDEGVKNLILAQDSHVFVTLNLFPYNPGHLMVVPRRHVVDPRHCNPEERASIEEWTYRLLDVLDELYNPAGYNIGYNIGESSGASIPHLHRHIVPRFKNEIGFLDVIGGTRVHVEDPAEALAKLKEALRGDGLKKDPKKRKK